LQKSRAVLSQNDVQEYLRRRLLADLHLGRLKPGHRAPSLRIVAAELGVGIRVVSRAYSQLAGEGLVTIRGRSGVYVAPQASVDPVLTESQAWYSTILTDAWSRRIPLPQLPELLQQFVSRRLSCACVESTEDHMVAFCSELDEDFGLDTISVMVAQDAGNAEDDGRRIREAMMDTDFVVTTAFHAAQVRAATQDLGKPVVVVSVNDALVDAIQRALRAGPVVMVAADHRFVARAEHYLIGAFAEHGQMRVLLIEQVLADPTAIGGAEPMVTRAARRQLNEPGTHLVAEPVPFLSLDAARVITQCMIAVQGGVALQPA
jgi:DNA-binding transcriptional regulator YhcF (GntR family)